ncbi:MAG: hypothetical protein ACLP9D_00510 [Candidatus Bathyarchaeia archaeon]
MPRIMSLEFEVDGIVTLIGTEQAGGGEQLVWPLFVAGEGTAGSKGFAVFAPLMPHTTNPILVNDNVVWTVTVSITSAVEAMAHHSPTTCEGPNGVDCLSLKLRPVAIGGPLKGEPVEVAKTITTSFGLLVENPVTGHDIVGARQKFEPEPSTDRVGELWTGVMNVRARRRLRRKRIRLLHKPKPTHLLHSSVLRI